MQSKKKESLHEHKDEDIYGDAIKNFISMTINTPEFFLYDNETQKNIAKEYIEKNREEKKQKRKK